MGYKKDNTLNEFDENDFALQHEWIGMLDQRSCDLFGPLLPYKKIPSYACSFVDMSPADQMYICGLLNFEQYLEMKIVSNTYQRECKQIIHDNYETNEQEWQTQSILPPTVYEIQPRLKQPVFHDPIINNYTNIVEKIRWAGIVYDLNSFNYEGRRFNLEDGQENYDILVPKDKFISDMRALEACLLVRNGCLNVPQECDIYLNMAVDHFCGEAVSNLLNVPENNLTQGATKRGQLAYGMFCNIFKGNGIIFTGKRAEIMTNILKNTNNLLSQQKNFNDEWQRYLSNWFNTLMEPYANSLIERMQKPKKVSEHPIQPSSQNTKQERQK